MKRLQTLEAFRGLASLSVVLYHVHDIVLTNTGTAPFGGVLIIGSRGTDFFLVLSGFIITLTHFGRDARSIRPDTFLLRRVVRLVPSLWVVSLLAVLVYAVGFGDEEKAVKLEHWHLLDSWFLLPQDIPPLINVSWTLVLEMFCYLLVAALMVSRRLGVVLLIAWQVAIVAVVAFGIDRGTLPGGYYLNARCMSFGVGVLCAAVVIHYDGPVLRRAAPVLLGTGALLFFSVLGWEGAVGAGERHVLLLPVTYLGSGMIMSGATLLERARGARVPRILTALGTVSYSVYLVHFGVITLAVAALVHVGVEVDDMTAIACGGLGMAAGVAFHHLVDSPIQAWLRQAMKRPKVSRGAAIAPGLGGSGSRL